MSLEYTILDFDSNLFEFKVVKILSPRASLKELQLLLMQLATQDVHLVYWAVDSGDAELLLVAKQMQGFLGGQQVTYTVNLRDLPVTLSVLEDVKTYEYNEPNADLENLAVQAGNYSHFKADPKFPSNLFFKLYMAWINNSVNGKVADVVLVTRRGDKIIGMITVGRKNDCGDIGLLAVASEYRGQNIGTNLVRSAQLYWRNRGITVGRVVTQMANKSACRLYENCGFKIAKIDNFYHFWL